jgi:hypothetical protein
MEQDDDIHADWDSNELSVLRSAELDTPPRGSVERTLAAIGAGAALGTGLGLGGASSLGGAAKAGSSMAHGSIWLKWLGAALVGGGLASAAFVVKHHEKRAPAAQIASPPAPAPVALAAPEPTSPAAQSEPGTVSPALSAAPVPPSPAVQAPLRSDTPDKLDSKDALAAEIRMIDEARARLRHGDPQGSLETLGRYDQLVKRGGSMRAEATVVRIEALQASGNATRAAALGERFLAKNPDSPYADYVKRILSQAN